MSDWEEHLSPISTNLLNIDLDESFDRGKRLVQQIRAQKIGVMEKKLDPSEANLVRSEIMASWMRSFDNGLDPFHYNYPPLMEKNAFQQRLKEKTFFLEAAEPYMCQFEKMLSDMGCYLFLTDENGVILRTANTLGENKFWLTPGAIWSEETTGTCSHGMSILLKSPIQVCGPEHFSQIFKNVSCSTAPVFNACGVLEGTLTISSAYLHNQSSQSLGLVMTIASAIQKEFQLSEKKALLSVALAAANDVVIVIKQDGTIVTVNAQAKNLFDEDLEGKRIVEVIGEQPLVATVLETGVPVLSSDVIVTKGHLKFNLAGIQPVTECGCPSFGVVLTLKELDQVGHLTVAKSTRCSPARFSFSQIVGSSDQTVETISLAKKFCRFDNNILLQGESGTGKEVYAQSIHNESRPDGPFVAVNCAAIPATLIESELFGYEAGAFTGAERKGKPGKIELANGGTLFLDEIGDMPLELQAVLLRVLEDKLVMRVGGSRYIPVNFRLVAATNRDLAELVKEKKFREDLYYRLLVFKVEITPLRQRGAEIIELTEFFISRVCQAQGLKRPALSNATKYVLLQYGWPGNVRQLQNVMSYALCMCDDGTVLPEHLPKDVLNNYINPVTGRTKVLPEKAMVEQPPQGDSNLSMKDIEKMVIKKALDDTNNHIRAAAKVLGISKSTIYRKIKEYDIPI